MDTKVCSVCGEEKSIDQFYFKNKKTGRRDSRCKRCKKEYHREWRKKHPNYMSKKSKERWAADPEGTRAYHRQYMRKRRKDDSTFYLDETMSGVLWSWASGTKKYGKKYEDILGYSASDLKRHLESQFHSGMTWDNYGDLWEIDHIKPKAVFSYESIEDEGFHECWNLENIRPLFCEQNRKRKYKEPDTIEERQDAS